MFEKSLYPYWWKGSHIGVNHTDSGYIRIPRLIGEVYTAKRVG